MAERTKLRKIVVTFQRREDGGLRAFSDDVPGFVLSHSDPQAVLNDVVPALEVILSGMFDARFDVSELIPVRPELEGAGIIDSLPDAATCAHREYAGQLRAA